MKITFSSQEELYHRLYPALRIKKREFKKQSVSLVREEDIWNYLKNKKWKKSSGLSLSVMVEDILSLTSVEILEYLIKEDKEII